VLDADGTARHDAQVAELTGLLRHSANGDRLAGWPADMRIPIRRAEASHRRMIEVSGKLCQPTRLLARHVYVEQVEVHL